MGFNLINWTYIYIYIYMLIFPERLSLENYGNIGLFPGLIWPDWGNTARANMAGLGVYRVKITKDHALS